MISINHHNINWCKTKYCVSAQPPGVPEICKRSLTSCPCTGGKELMIFGKNFLKDTQILFQLDNDSMPGSTETPWECSVVPDKEFLQQIHLSCIVPPYRRQDLAPAETILVKMYAISSGKTSEPHTFTYTSAPKINENLPTVETTGVPASINESVLPNLPTVPLVSNVTTNSELSFYNIFNLLKINYYQVIQLNVILQIFYLQMQELQQVI